MAILNRLSWENQSGNHIFLLHEPKEQNAYSTITKNKENPWIILFVLLHLKHMPEKNRSYIRFWSRDSRVIIGTNFTGFESA